MVALMQAINYKESRDAERASLGSAGAHLDRGGDLAGITSQFDRVFLAGEVDNLRLLNFPRLALEIVALCVFAHISNQTLVQRLLEEKVVLRPLGVLFVVLVVPAADPAVFVLAPRLGKQLSRQWLTISSISMRDSATRLRWSTSS